MGKSILEGKMERWTEEKKRKKKKAIGKECTVCDAFNKQVTEVGRLTQDGGRFQCKKIDRRRQTIQLQKLKTVEY